MARKDEITVGCKVSYEQLMELRNEAFVKGVGVNRLLREMIGSREKLREISEAYEVSEEVIIEWIVQMLSTGKVYVENGELLIRE